MNKVIFQAEELPEEPAETDVEAADPSLVGWEPRRGAICPVCGEGKLNYDGLLNLTCSHCGYTLGGCFT